jgi:hypothetical protein
VFTRNAGAWAQYGNKLVGTGGVGSPFQGTSVALSADGGTAISGGTDDSSGTGAAWVFALRPGVIRIRLFAASPESPARTRSAQIGRVSAPPDDASRTRSYGEVKSAKTARLAVSQRWKAVGFG